MPSTPSTLAQEAQAALSGTLRVLIGRRDASDYFVDSPRGLVGSFIALLIGVGLSVMLGGGGLGNIMLLCLLYAGQTGAVFIVLRQVGKGHRFVIYLTASNWASGLFTALTSILESAGMFSNAVTTIPATPETPEIPITALMIFVWIVTLMLQVNLARIVAELRILHVIMLLIAQFVGAMFAMMIAMVLLG